VSELHRFSIAAVGSREWQDDYFVISTIIWHLSPFLIYSRWLILEFFYTYNFLLILFNMLIKLLMYILDSFMVSWKINIIHIFLFFFNNWIYF
jgi:hypothetical protein